MPNGFPRSQLSVLEGLAARIIETRRPGTASDILARDLLGGFYEICMRSGLDGVLAQVEQAFAPLEIAGLADDPKLRAALAARLDDKSQYDEGGPRAARLRQLAECLLATVSLAPVDDADRTITLPDAVRSEVASAMTSVVEVELAAPKLRADIIANARAGIEERHLTAFDKLTAQLDERGLRVMKQPKIPLDASQAAQQRLGEARQSIFERVTRAAIDRAQQVIARANPEAAARLDQPVTLRLTPRDVAIDRANDPLTSKVPASFVHTLLESITELARIAWTAAERTARTYGASQTFAVGELIDHPKFGRGTVTAVVAQKIEVEFPDGKHTLVHAAGGTAKPTTTPPRPRVAPNPRPSEPDEDS